MQPLRVTHFTDPGCPWAYSAWPSLTALAWRYGDGLAWEHVLIGLTEERAQYERRGYTPAGMAASRLRFARYGMPFGGAPKPAVAATGRACRAIVAARRQDESLTVPALRALHRLQFTTSGLLDDDHALLRALQEVPGLDATAAVEDIDTAEVAEAYEFDRLRARSAAGTAAEAQGKTAQTDGPVRFTAPTLVLGDGERRLVAGGHQSLEAYDLCVANLRPDLARRADPGSAFDVLAAFPYPLTTAEIAETMRAPADPPDRAAVERELLERAAAGEVALTACGDGVLWAPAQPASRRAARAMAASSGETPRAAASS